ncbi:MAG: site-specific integrase [Pseudodesulfovibrio sp.]|uniref:tyrosine-type recombinase/integrase n=1 Tax=Pseudodesulfovibrio sp. TaxID=2035812 RepID=UPI001DA802EE|nr:tyrosine-type recombinase/integrase [Pseudodesulfovibrio sp.]MBV1765952.1 site-specific integrase [Pseudodesulfovibrio sp.]
MTIYSKAGKGFRYDFMVKGKRYTKAWFRTKREAQAAQAQRKKEVAKADKMAERNDMGLLDMLNRRLDTLQERSFSTQYYKNTRYAAQRLLKHFGDVPCSTITSRMADDYLLSRSRSSTPLAANADLLLLRATFAWAMKRGQRFIADNPFAGLESFPSHLAEKKRRTPDSQTLDRIIAAAKPEDHPYLWVIRETLARSVEVHRLKWKRVNFEDRYVELKTFKNKDRKPVLRQVPMTDKLYEVLSELYARRDPEKEWVFWCRSYSHKLKRMVDGPYTKGRYTMLKTACRKAGVGYYSFHRFRASGASVMDNNGALISGIQHLLGHADRRSTEIYLEKLRNVERDAMAIYEAQSRRVA